MATTIKLKNGSGAPLAGDLVAGEPALDLTNKRLYTEDSGGTVIEIGTSPSTIDINAGTIDGTVIGGASASAGTFTTFTSTGIDDNATSTAITIDSSQNVGIGTASPSYLVDARTASGNAQIHLRSGGDLAQLLLISNDTTGTSQINFGDADANNVGLISYSHNQNALKFTSNSAERMRIDSSGNVGIGTTSPSAKLHVTGDASNYGILAEQPSGYGGLNIKSTTVSQTWSFLANDNAGNSDLMLYGGSSAGVKLTVDSSGNVGIGTTSPATLLHLNSASDTYFTIGTTNATADARIQFRNSAGTDAGGLWYATSGNSMQFRTNSAERMRIDSSGNLLVGTTSALSSTKMVVENTVNGNYVSSFRHTNTSPYGIHVYYSNATPPNNISNRFIDCEDTGGFKFQVRSNGGIANFQANDANLSDQRAKKDIVASGSYLEKLCNIPVRNFRYNEDAEDSKHHLGVIAQEVEAVAPELVSKASWEHKDGPMDTVYNTDLMFAMMKSIQELSAQVTELKAEVAALKGA